MSIRHNIIRATILVVLLSSWSLSQAQVEDKYNYWQDDDYSFNGGTRVILGYAVNVPSQDLGFTLGFTRPRTWGIYLGYKMNIETLELANYLYDELTVEYVEREYYYDTLKDIRSYWVTVDAGLTWPLSNRFCAYAGSGLSFHKFYRQYHEPYGYKGDNGFYWINDDVTSSVSLNLSAGVYYRLGRYFYLQLGGDLHPFGLGAGIGLAL